MTASAVAPARRDEREPSSRPHDTTALGARRNPPSTKQASRWWISSPNRSGCGPPLRTPGNWGETGGFVLGRLIRRHDVWQPLHRVPLANRIDLPEQEVETAVKAFHCTASGRLLGGCPHLINSVQPAGLAHDGVNLSFLFEQDLHRNSMAGEHLLCQGTRDGCRFIVKQRTSFCPLREVVDNREDVPLSGVLGRRMGPSQVH